jgi:membrane carboxypeptidase/penicillin-binding protein PbpC
MAKPPKKDSYQRSPEEAARARDAILKRMLQTKPKQQKDLIAERKGKKK